MVAFADKHEITTDKKRYSNSCRYAYTYTYMYVYKYIKYMYDCVRCCADKAYNLCRQLVVINVARKRFQIRGIFILVHKVKRVYWFRELMMLGAWQIGIYHI